MNVILIGGAEIKRLCGTVCDYTSACVELINPTSNEDVSFYQKEDNDYVFCNPMFLQAVVDQVDLSNKVLITHNSDASLVDYSNGVAMFRYLNGMEWSVSNLNPRDWFAQNSLTTNVKPLPLGPGEEPFDIPVPLEPLRKNKNHLIYKNFKVDSNPIERGKCDHYVKATNYYNHKLPRNEYYDMLTTSYYCVSPDGYGVDCHRHWEAIYYSCIPIVTRNQLTEFYSRYYPMCLIDDWSLFKVDDYTPELHDSMMKTFDRKYLTLDYYIANTKI